MNQNFYRIFNQHNIVFFFLIACIQITAVKGQSHQDCIDAISVCTNTYTQTNSSAGFGNIQEITAGATCLGNGETNSTWYAFSIQNPGTLVFQIDPLNTQDDYDFVLYKFNGNCSDIVNGIVSPLRCNYSSAAGSTGLAQGSTGISVSSNGLNQCAPITVLQNEKYLLMVNNFTATNSGYTLSFSGSATIYDTEPPELSNTNITSCGPSMAYVYFNESIKCATIAANGSDFKVTGPSGVSVSSAAPLSNNMTLLTPGIKVYFTNPITVPGNYTLHIKNGSDGNTLSDFCDNFIPNNSTIDFQILYSSPVATITSAINANCNNNDGSATAAVNGGTPPYNYSWNSNPVQQSLIASNLSPGLYTFVVTDANECTGQANAVITSIGIPHLAVTITPELCGALNNGSATVTVSGGVPPFTFAWNTNPVQTTATASGLSEGSYTVIVTGANGCTASITAVIPLSGLPVINISHSNIPCDNSTSGSATATVTGIAPFTYLWSTGQTTVSVSGLVQGSYTLTVMDVSGCTSSSSIVIMKGGMQLSVATVNLLCGNIHNGTATVTAGQSIPPLTYSWNTNPAQTTPVAINLAEGSFTVTVTDATGCRDSITAVITGPPPLVANIVTTDAGCTLNDGSATVSISGGHGPYNYLWNTQPVLYTPTASNLFAGAYQVMITDSDHCTVDAMAYVNNFDGPNGFISDVVNATCNQPNGSASVINVSGNGPFTYEWYTNPPQYGATAIGLAAGIYTVKIRDHEGCLSFLNVKINATGVPELAENFLVNASCGMNDGQASVNVSGGTAPYSYQWFTDPHQYTQTALGLGAGVYTIVVTDSSGCKASLQVTIAENKAHNDFTFTTSCINEPAFFNGITDYPGTVTWRWDFGDTLSGQDNAVLEQNASHTFSSTGNYTVTLYVNGGCATDTLVKMLNESAKPDASFTYFPQAPFATAPVDFSYTGSAATDWFWDFGDDGISYDPDPVHTYKTPGSFEVSLYVTDQYGCKDTAESSLDIDQAPAVFVPSGFTPNGDGINDNLIIPSHGMKSCDFKIFDRWGALIFQCNNPSFINDVGWNGYSNGRQLSEGSYAYLLNGRLENDKPVVLQGFINLLR